MRLVKIGGNLTATIPRDMARELGLLARDYMLVQRGEGRSLILTASEEWTRERERIRGRRRRADR